MPNMSYCMFQNTLGDLEACAERFDAEDLSTDEAEARLRMVNVMADIFGDLGVELDEKQLRQAIKDLEVES